MATSHNIMKYLKLFSDSHWLISSTDEEALCVVEGLARAMSLSPVSQSPKPPYEKIKKLIVATDPGISRPTTGLQQPGSFLCLLPRPRNTALFVIGMTHIAQVIAQAEEERGGLLVHGALAFLPPLEAGVLLAGPGSVGKSTASRRLPLPWCSLSDDSTLVVRDSQGNYFAHPWPTWSQFYDIEEGKPGPGGRWEMERAVPLKAVFFLKQAEEDKVEALSMATAISLLMETVEHVSPLRTHDLSHRQIHKQYARRLTWAEELLKAVPAYILHISLTGYFWLEIEKVLKIQKDKAPARSETFPPPPTASFPGGIPSHATGNMDNPLLIRYTGPSMHPTLRQSDLLEVVPYNERVIRVGDVIYFLPPEGNQRVVHRVIRITEEGIYTRGDNNAARDPYLVQLEDVAGQVKAAWRYGKRRKIAGGLPGLFTHYCAGIRRKVHHLLSLTVGDIYRHLGRKIPLYQLMPSSLRPRVYVFGGNGLPPELKLMVRGHVIGRFHLGENSWHINRPWRLFIDEESLPVVLMRPLTQPMSLEDLKNLYSIVPGAKQEKTNPSL